MTPSLLKCLLAVLALSNACESVVSKDVAHLLGVKRSSVHRTLEVLQEKGYIHKRPYGDIFLTETGMSAARSAEDNKDEITILLSRRCEIPMDEAANAAVLLICELSPDSLDKLKAGLKN